MKYLLTTLLLLQSFVSLAATTPWTSYPTTNTFGDTDTFIIGNGSTNLVMVGSGVKSAAQVIANTSSNLVYGNANTAINTSSNLVLGNAQTAINTSSNLVYGNGVTQINTTSNLLNTLINTSSNLTFGNALTQINTTSNSLQSQIIAGGVTAVTATNISQSIANTSSNLVYGNAVTQINTTSNTLAVATATKASSATTVTISGTANQINSSTATPQPLSGNVSSALSLSSTMVAPGTLEVTGSQTNAANLSVLGNTTNFGTVKVVGNQTNVGTLSVTGNSTNFGNAFFKGNATVVGTVAAATLTGNGAGITSLDGANMTAGSLSSNRLDAASLAQLFAFNTALASGSGVFTNDSSGNYGHANFLDASSLKASQYVASDASTNLVSTQNGNNWTNTIPHTAEGTTTNISFTFNGTLQSFTVTNGPTVFLTPSGANGSVSFRFTTNATIKFLGFYPAWLAGSNAVNPVITNGMLTLTSLGGTNCVIKGSEQIEAAMKENQ